MEVRVGEAGVLRAALGEVQAMDGIDARVRMFLWSGGVVDGNLSWRRLGTPAWEQQFKPAMAAQGLRRWPTR